MSRIGTFGIWAMALGLMGLAGGCGTSSSETGSADAMTQNVGVYDAAPAGIEKPRVGVPPWNVQGTGDFSDDKNLDELAADQMTTLLENSDRFRVIERAQLQKLLDEQNMEGIVAPGELAKPGLVKGVDYLVLGRVTNLSVKAEKTSTGFGLGNIGGLIDAGVFDYKDKSSKITSECGVDIRLVDPTTGEIVVASTSDYKKTDSISAFGVDVLGASADSDADVTISEDDKGKILRLALDDSLRKAMPKIDKFLISRPPTPVAPPTSMGTQP